MSVVDLAEVRAAKAHTSAADDEAVAAALALARAALGRRALSSAEVDRKLVEGSVDADVREVVIAQLTNERVLDDAALAADVAARLQGRRGAGWQRVRAELGQRGLDAALVEQPDSDSELARATELASARVARSPDRSEAGRRRLSAWLARRGYSGGVCRSAVEAAFSSSPN